ncbi:MAG TPA: class I SAM-dependent methyltransferase [Methanobacterium sp.]|jgi:ubiquinone/menaquinone biosynthesis C-methylase UbiE|nr:class I SAM-dependent methyltransferase [Methanobacterium sp.]
MTVKPRVPEGGAIEDTNQMSMEDYSEIMKKRLGGEYIKFAENVINKVYPFKNSKVLEIGPGPGWAGINVLKMREDLYLDGLEASTDMVRVATQNAALENLSDRTKYFHGIGEDMKTLPDDDYDLVISRDSMHHWDYPEQVFLEISRVLKKNGKLYIHDSRRDLNIGGKLIVNIFGHFMAGKMLKYWKSSIAASYTPEEISKMLEKNGLNDWIVEADLMDLSIQKR